MKAISPTEKQIQDSIIEYLRLKKYMIIRLNSGNQFIEGKNGKTYRIKLSDPGTPDILAFGQKENYSTTSGSTIGIISLSIPLSYHPLNLYFIEVKRPGGKVTELQRQKMEELERFGAKCLVIHSLEELQRQLV